MAQQHRFWTRSRRSRSSVDVWTVAYRSAFAVGLIVAGWGAYRTVLFAYGSEKLEIRNVQVRGERRVTESEIFARIANVPGSNALRIRLDEVRASVESLDWVRHATVHRVWPNELAISVVEREVVALGRIDGTIFQVDADGTILPLDSMADTSVPVLDGLVRPRTREDVEDNAAKIDRYLRLLEELDADELSEVHVSGSGDVSIIPVDEPVVVELGADDHVSRWERYQALKERIHSDFPEATRIDLRFKDQVIIQVEDDLEPAEQIIWGDETKLL